MICNAHPIFFILQNRNNEMGGACSAYEGGEKGAQGFGGET